MFKAIFFDLDETLIAVMNEHKEANRRVFASYGIDFSIIENQTRKHDFLGKRLIDILGTMRDTIDQTETYIPLEELAKKREEIFLELVENNGSLLPGAKEAIIYAKKQNKTVAIVSSGTRKYIRLVIKLFHLQPYIDFIVGEEDVVRGKPYPDCYEKAYSLLPKKMDIKKEECLVVEDSPNGARAAKAAGLKLCFVPFFPYKEVLPFDYTLKTLELFQTIA